MPTHARTRVLALLVSVLAVGACDEDPEARRAIDVGGSIDNRVAAPLPDPAQESRVIVAWVVTSGSPDYTYVWGQGTIAASGESFSLRLDAPPPDSALNADAVGVGLIMAVEGSGFENGQVLPESLAGVIGLAGQHAVIYVGERIEGPEWLDAFPDGYSVGVGVDLEGGFDGFEPTGAGSIDLIIDDLENIEVVNWT